MRTLTAVVLAVSVALAGCTYESSGTTTSVPSPIDANVSLGPADLVLLDQAIDGTSVAVRSVTLPGPGFVAIYRVADDGELGERLGVSDRLQRGITANVVVPLDETLAGPERLVAMVHIDVDRNGAFTYEPPDDLIDEPGLFANGAIARDDGAIRILPPLAPAAIVVTADRSNGRGVVVDRIELPAPGFVSVRTDLDGEPDELIGVSELLEAGVHTDLVAPIDEPRRVSQTLWITVHVDRDEDGRFDFGPAGGPDVEGVTDSGEPASTSVRFEIVPLDPTSIVGGTTENTDGDALTVESVTLPGHGFVVVRTSDGDVVAVSDLLEGGISEGVVIALPEALVPGSYLFVVEAWIDFDRDDAFDEEMDRLGFEVVGNAAVAATDDVTLVVPEPVPETTTTTAGG